MFRSGRLRARLRRPDAEDLVELGRREFLTLGKSEAAEYAAIIDDFLHHYDRLDELVWVAGADRQLLRNAGHVATPEEDPFGAFIRLCDVPGSGHGPLQGLRSAVKDNIAIAGIPMTNGSRTAPYVPMTDAVAVERVLGAGASIVGTLNMDDFSGGGLGETSAWGPTLNPLDTSRAAGGSSAGAGAAVASGSVDFALGVDNGGSARIPASYCGIAALKPTHGLVPTYGLTHLDHTLDAVCPMARTVSMVARVIDVISGADDRDPQWVRGSFQPTQCASALGRGVRGLRVGVLDEIGTDENEPAVSAAFSASLDSLREAGAEVTKVSVPLWRDAWSIGVPLYVQGTWGMIQSEGQGFGHLGQVEEERVRALALSRRLEADEFPPLRKVYLLLGRYMHEKYWSMHLARAQNLRRRLRHEITLALDSCDVLVTPTTPTTAPVAATGRPSDSELLNRTLATPANTVAANLSGHPALVVPNGADHLGMPTSIQLIASHFAEEVLFPAGEVVEDGAR